MVAEVDILIPGVSFVGEAFMSPATMAECWKDAERTSMDLREKTIGMLKKRGVCHKVI